MSTTPPPSADSAGNGSMFRELRDQLADQLDSPLGYHAKLVAVLVIYVHELLEKHHGCTGCNLCPDLADLVDLVHAHNSLQVLDQATGKYRPYPLMKGVIPTAGTTGAGA